MLPRLDYIVAPEQAVERHLNSELLVARRSGSDERDHPSWFDHDMVACHLPICRYQYVTRFLEFPNLHLEFRVSGPVLSRPEPLTVCG